MRYRERQLPPAYSFVPPLLFIPAIWVVAAPFDGYIGLAIGVAIFLIVTALKVLGAQEIIVDNKFLQLGKARIPLKVLGKITVVSKAEQFAARGPKLHANAFAFLKYGLPEMIQIEINDPKDPTPYVLISTRNAQELKQALSAKRTPSK